MDSVDERLTPDDLLDRDAPGREQPRSRDELAAVDAQIEAANLCPHCGAESLEWCRMKRCEARR